MDNTDGEEGGGGGEGEEEEAAVGWSRSSESVRLILCSDLAAGAPYLYQPGKIFALSRSLLR